jgi:hypothetical protein
MSHVASQPRLDEKAVSELLNTSLAAIRSWRCEGRGPAFVKVESAVRYRAQDVESDLRGRTVAPPGSFRQEEAR